ncbi:uncharacterized protein EAF01_004705 [Botrytis porri]|uniref:Uncharacterized protein n=1 Tax=Botrytis porri TaxID=87229 RepID=A0A4Z1KQJ9_9HELO|nr:uncharacterized protein EAF01_004705 [Botrytis porri]KAF7907118.1 hypothetical protein EAF01_004705 [Botrytis porri]TGO83725.1 hypothetical protein BPOR_0601g00050 [Botrytis porri]
MKRGSREAERAKKLRSLGPNTRIYFTRLLAVAGTVCDHGTWLFTLALQIDAMIRYENASEQKTPAAR